MISPADFDLTLILIRSSFSFFAARLLTPVSFLKAFWRYRVTVRLEMVRCNRRHHRMLEGGGRTVIHFIISQMRALYCLMPITV